MPPAEETGANGAAARAAESPCLEHDCHACCVGTRMTLTGADVERLEALGHRGFWRRNRDHDLQLELRDGRCPFLADGRCTVYPARPEGCALYPLVWELDAQRAVLDAFCPHRAAFAFDASELEALRRSVETEEREAATRRRAGIDIPERDERAQPSE